MSIGEEERIIFKNLYLTHKTCNVRSIEEESNVRDNSIEKRKKKRKIKGIYCKVNRKLLLIDSNSRRPYILYQCSLYMDFQSNNSFGP